MKKWECTICGYIHEGDTPPDECPVCGADSSAFVEVVEEAPEKTASAEIVPESAPDPPKTTLIARATDLILKFHLHPISVHTPNGVIPMIFIFLLIAGLLGAPSFGHAAFYSLIFVLLNMPFVLYTGYITWQNKYKGAMTSVFKIKIGASLVSTGLLCILIIWRYSQPEILETGGLSAILFTLLGLVLLGTVGIAGHLGGKLVFGKD
ncbi:rubredoxin-like domain-containing protein [Desulfogranum japonicum]|uniref:rubredoxin-like domain-containing protein n=1 Tax=Desulfogranum japonicum TaxID=231447 RepID=UPI0004298FB1|nr:DUF2231 domain-containing protein [Desulfogranum japonicum]